jgi:glycosyltransferase involved in cell wall biosynthesis
MVYIYMKITIITVCFNSSETIGDTLDSVYKQTYKNIEHIIIDGMSTDNTLEIITKKGAHVSKLISEKDNGIYDAMNKGIHIATGDVIGFLNSDDVFAEVDVISSIAKTMADSSVDACYGDLVYVDQYDVNKVVRYWRSCKYQTGLFERGWVAAHPTFYARREIYQKFGGFDLNLTLAADFDVILRFLRVQSITSAYIPEVMVKMRLGGASNSGFFNLVRQNIEIANAFRKYNLDVGIKLFIFRLVSRCLQFIRKPSSF